MRNLLHSLFSNEGGQDLAEYGIALAIVAAGVGLIAVAIAGDVSSLWSRGQSAISSVV